MSDTSSPSTIDGMSSSVGPASTPVPSEDLDHVDDEDGNGNENENDITDNNFTNGVPGINPNHIQQDQLNRLDQPREQYRTSRQDHPCGSGIVRTVDFLTYQEATEPEDTHPHLDRCNYILLMLAGCRLALHHLAFEHHAPGPPVSPRAMRLLVGASETISGIEADFWDLRPTLEAADGAERARSGGSPARRGRAVESRWSGIEWQYDAIRVEVAAIVDLARTHVRAPMHTVDVERRLLLVFARLLRERYEERRDARRY